MNEFNTLEQAGPDVQRKFIAGVYLKMVFALAITGVVAFFTEDIYMYLIEKGIMNLSNYKIFMYAPIVLELILVIVLSAAINKLSPFVAGVMFVLYSVTTGFSLSFIFQCYDITSVYKVFGVSAAMFLGMTIYGATTKSDLSSAGRYLMMALIGLIIMSLLNMFMKSSGLDWILCLVGVGIFVGLTAYDTQKIMRLAAYSDGSNNFRKYEIIGALELYLDFINIFIKMLALFGKRK